MVTFVIGGQPYEAGALTFKQLKKVWPFVADTLKTINGPRLENEEAMKAGFESVTSACKILEIALEKKHPEMTAEVIEDTLLPKEVPGISAALQELMDEAGLIVNRPQMPAGGERASPSTATGTQSSPSSSQQESKEEAGTP